MKDYNEIQNYKSMLQFEMGIKELLSKEEKTQEETNFVENYYERSPLIVSNSVMNKICYYLEEFNFGLKEKLKISDEPFDYTIYKNKDVSYTNKEKREVLKKYEEFKKLKAQKINTMASSSEDEVEVSLADNISTICSNNQVVLSILVDYLYGGEKKGNKDILWLNYGKEIFKNIVENTNKPMFFPFKNQQGDIEYLGERYKREMVTEWIE